MRDLDEWGEEHGFSSYRCPRCKRRFYTDSAVECPNCGESDEPKAEEAEEEDEV